jgi:hypothetical protein
MAISSEEGSGSVEVEFVEVIVLVKRVFEFVGKIVSCGSFN